MNVADLLSKIHKGDRVRFRRTRDTLFETGTVALIWHCLDTLSVDVTTDDGGSVSVIPELGDAIELQEAKRD